MIRGVLQYKHYALGLLTIVAAFTYLDRGVLALMVEPLKQDLQLSDTEIGFLNGFAFALFYAVAGIPIARWADRGNRNSVVTLTTALWGSMLALSAFVGNFLQLLLVRVGVAVGEAGCLPPAQSLISDYFKRAERPRAMAIYWLCGPISGIIAYLGGGWLVENFGWRMTFLLMGLPGVLIAVLVKLTLREPRLKKNQVLVQEAAPFCEVLVSLWSQRTFRNLGIAFCIFTFFGAGIGIWLPAFFMRSHAMGVGEVGLWFAFVTGGVGMVGTYLGGYLASRFAADKERVHMQAVALALCVCSVLSIACYLSRDKYIALLFKSGFTLLLLTCYGPVFSALQSLTPERMRSSSIALIYLFSNLIGLGVGPLFAGMLSDQLTPFLGQDALRYTLVVLSPGYLWCAWHFWTASKTIDDDIRAVESGSNTEVVEEATPVICAVK